MPPSSDACPTCGAKGESEAQPVGEETGDSPAAAAAPVALPVAPPTGRVASHLRLLMVLWLAQGVFLLLILIIPGLVLLFPAGMAQGMTLEVMGLLHLQSPLGNLAWALLLMTAACAMACLLVARGLLDHAPWARTYTIVVSAIALLAYPQGTALGVYTLWVLLPESSEAEYRQLTMQ